MRYLFLVIVSFLAFSCNTSDDSEVRGVLGGEREQGEDADAVATMDEENYIYGVFKLHENMDTGELSFLMRLKVTEDGYPETLAVKMSLGGETNPLEQHLYVTKPIQIKPLAGIYALPSTYLWNSFKVYAAWNHKKRQAEKVMLVITTTTCDRESGNNGANCEVKSKNFVEIKQLEYNQQEAKKMFHSLKTLPAPATDWSVTDMEAFGDIIELYRISEPDIEDLPGGSGDPETVSDKLKRILGYTEEAIENFKNTSGIKEANNDD